MEFEIPAEPEVNNSTSDQRLEASKKKKETNQPSLLETPEITDEGLPLTLDDVDEDDDLQRLMLALKKAGNAKTKKRREKFNMITKELQSQFEDFVTKQKEKFDKDWETHAETQRKEVIALETEIKSWQTEVAKLVTAYQSHILAVSRGHARLLKRLGSAIAGSTEKDELRMKYAQALQSMVTEGKKIITQMQTQVSHIKVD